MTATVLYIDDKYELPAQVDTTLLDLGYRLVHTADPAEAMRWIAEAPPALVLTEVLLPGSDGFDLIDQINRHPSPLPIPIVVVTRGERTPSLYGRALEASVEDFVCKPFVRAQILEIVLAFARAEAAPSTEAAEAAVAESNPPEAGPSIEGELAAQPLPEVLGRLYRAGATGVLTLQRGNEVCSLELRNGSPVEVERHRNVKPFADYLLETNRIDAVQYEMLVDQLMARVAGPGEILLGMSALSESQLVSANYAQAREVLLALCEWTSGQYAFLPGRHLEMPATLELAHNPIQLILTGVSRLAKEVVRDLVDERRGNYVSLGPSPETRLDDAALSPKQRAAAESLAGDRTLAEVLAATDLDARTLYRMVAIGAVELDEFPVLILDEELKPVEVEEFEALPESALEPEPLLTIRELPTQAVARPPPASAPRPAPRPTSRPVPAPTPAPTPAPGQIESQIDEIAERLSSEDDFGLFGIDEKARDPEVYAAYQALLARLNLELLPPDLDELRARAEKLRARIESAYRRVRTEDTRRAFAGLRKKKQARVEEQASGTRGVEAEKWFRTGEGHLLHEKFDQAVEAFGMALHLDPEEGDYAAHLGYALYRSNPRNTIIRREALEHVAKGVKLAPHREKPLLFLSRIFRETGDEAMAAKVLRRALKEHPDNPALVQEMCLTRAGDSKSKSKSFLDRLRRH